MMVLETARRIADEVLFPAAAKVDGADRIPASHLDLLAREGLYGIEDPETAASVAEILASGCLATAFVWIQHRGALRAARLLGPEWYDALRRGEWRGGIAYGAVRPGPPSVRARRVTDGWTFTGETPWVTGWGMVDVLHVAARDDSDIVVYALVDAAAGGSLAVEPVELVAVNASRTVVLRLHELNVPDDRVTGTVRHAEVLAADAGMLRTNGSLALGVVDRCCRLLGPGPFDAALVAARSALDSADVAMMPAARAAACELALRAAAALTVTEGARSVLRDQHAQRLIREATFLLVFGSRPAIRANLLDRLAGIAVPGGLSP